MAGDPLPLDPADCRRWQQQALVLGAAGLALLAAGWWTDRPAVVRSYLWAYNFWLGIALGSLVLGMLQYLTGGVWGLILRRILEAASRTLPLLAVLFLPIALGMSDVYVWMNPEVVAADERLRAKAAYLNSSRYLSFAAGYFAIWIALAWAFNRWSVGQDRADAPENPRHLRKLCAAGLTIYALTITVASVDWVMSLEPLWYSSIFAPLFGVGQVLSAFAFATVVLILLSNRPPLAGVLARPHFRDLGSLLLAFVMVWAYLAFSQFLLMWSGNLTTENPYYLRRMQGGWQYVGIALIVGAFFLPFLLLLSGDVKRRRSKLLRVAILVLVMRAVDLYWLIVPAQPGADGLGAVPLGYAARWTDIVAPVAIGGVWLAAFLGQLQVRPLLPAHDPLLAEARHHE